MGVIRSIIGGLIGAAIAVAISIFLNVEASTGFSWFPIIIGLLTGLGAMLMGGRNFGIASVISGAAAAAIALVAILTGADAALLITQSTTNFGPTLSKEQIEKSSVAAEESNATESKASPSEQEDTEIGDDGEEVAGDKGESQSQETEGTDAEVASDSESDNGRTSTTAFQSPDHVAATQSPFNVTKFLYSVLGVLVAYQMGRGFGSKKNLEEVPAVNETKIVNA